jgi:DedD protein
MDRALKERVIGAIVLVVVAVLVVPVFLDGPSSDGDVVSSIVTLPGQSEQAGMTQTVVLNRDRKEPVPASAPVQVETKPEPVKTAPPAVTQEAAVVSPNDDSESVTAAESATAESATGMWAVQLGSFSNQENAERLAADLRKQGYAAFLSRLVTDSGALHRVRIGPQKDRESAEAVAAQLAKSGHSGQVVPHP